MKKLGITLVLVAISCMTYAQMLTYGPMVGVGASTVRLDDQVSEAGFAYHVGGFVRAKVLMLYVQPGIVFQSLSTGEDIMSTHNRLDVPINVGWKLLIFDLNAGPVFHAPLSSTTGDVDDLDLYADFATSWQVGLGVELGPMHVGARYQGGISNVLDTDLFDSRWRQFYVHVEYQF